MLEANQWSEEDVETALAELRRRHPTLSGGMFRVLLRTAMQEVAPPDLPALIECADKIVRALGPNQ